jgi:hypothetical protein
MRDLQLSRGKNFVRNFVLSFGALLLIGVVPFAFTDAQSTTNEQRDCDSNAVIRCGVNSTSELRQQYNDHSDAKAIFDDFGISSQDVNQMSTNAVNGMVTKGGRVMVNGKTVATNAQTAGRQNMAGSTAVSHNGTTFYMRPTSTSFNANSLSAYVVMKGDRFQYAVLKSCGNPVKATPVAKPAPAPTPAPAPAPQPQQPAAVQSSAACKMITANVTGGRTVQVAVTSEITNAQVLSYTINFGDGSQPQVLTLDGSNTSNNSLNSAATTTSTDPAPTSQSTGNTSNTNNTDTTVDSTDNGSDSTTVNNSSEAADSGSLDSTTTNNSSTDTGGTAAPTNMASGTNTNNTAISNTSTTITHVYPQDGTYFITASVQVRYADGRMDSLMSEGCKTSVTFRAETPPPAPVAPTATPPAPQPPAALPNTGLNVSDSIGLAALVAFLGTVLHQLYTRKNRTTV